MDQMGNELKKILMAGIGAVSISFEKAQEIINTLAQKGEITFEQAKILSEEIVSKVKKAIDESAVKKVFDGETTQDTIIRDLDGLSSDELARIREAIDKIESRNKKDRATQE